MISDIVNESEQNTNPMQKPPQRSLRYTHKQDDRYDLRRSSFVMDVDVPRK